MEEIWKPIKNYEKFYEVSNLGNVKSKRRNIILKYNINNKGRPYVNLFKNKKAKTRTIHRLVAETFIPNPNNFPEVNHKDENPLNNKVENLEWCDRKYNINYGTRKERIIKKQIKPVLQYDLKGNFIKKWNSIKEAQLFYNTNIISQCCKNKKSYNLVKGFQWKYEEDTKEISEVKQIGIWLKKQINQYDINNNYLKTWESIIEASKSLNIKAQNISSCCRNKAKTAGGYIWKYK